MQYPVQDAGLCVSVLVAEVRLAEQAVAVGPAPYKSMRLPGPTTRYRGYLSEVNTPTTRNLSPAAPGTRKRCLSPVIPTGGNQANPAIRPA